MAPGVFHAATAFSALTGTWTFARAFEPGIGTMTGTADFRPLGRGSLHYREDGRLDLASGHSGDAWREYHYVLDGDTIRVCFAGIGLVDRTLHVLRPGPDGATDVHHCADDTYTGHYAFADLPDRFTIGMSVTGPAKGYTTLTSYVRA